MVQYAQPFDQQQTPQPPLDQPWYGISMGAAFMRFFKKYATFSGRASRGEYWWWYLWNILISVIPAMVIMVGSFRWMFDMIDKIDRGYEPTVSEVFSGAFTFGMGPFGAILFGLIMAWGLAVFVPGLAISWRRLHDTGRSGLWYLISFAPFGGIVLIVLLAQKTDPRPNQWDYPPGTWPPNQAPVYGAQPGYYMVQPVYQAGQTYGAQPGQAGQPYGAQPGQGGYPPAPGQNPGPPAPGQPPQ